MSVGSSQSFGGGRREAPSVQASRTKFRFSRARSKAIPSANPSSFYYDGTGCEIKTWIVHALEKGIAARPFTLLRPRTGAVRGVGGSNSAIVTYCRIFSVIIAYLRLFTLNGRKVFTEAQNRNSGEFDQIRLNSTKKYFFKMIACRCADGGNGRWRDCKWPNRKRGGGIQRNSRLLFIFSETAGSVL